MTRRFKIWEYTISHSQLLLRSVRDEANPSRVDVARGAGPVDAGSGDAASAAAVASGGACAAHAPHRGVTCLLGAGASAAGLHRWEANARTKSRGGTRELSEATQRPRRSRAVL